MAYRSCCSVSLCHTIHGRCTHVEVRQDDNQTTVLRTEHVLGGDLDVVKGDVGCTCRSRVGSLDLLGLDTFTSRYKESSQTTIGLPISPAPDLRIQIYLGAYGLKVSSGRSTHG